MGLEEYNKKRDFSESKEPTGNDSKSKDNIFVVQKHDASHLHYDFRISVRGVLKSWAVPKGPSLNPSVKRLAIMTEDHPYDYKDFEGTIPKGHYGAGKVIVWDNGSYENIADKSMGKALDTGHIKIKLEGKKLKGGYAFTRINKKKNQWLLIKTRDEYISEDNILKDKPKSVISGKEVNEI